MAKAHFKQITVGTATSYEVGNHKVKKKKT